MSARVKAIPVRPPVQPGDCEKALFTVLYALPNQRARYYASDVLVGYAPRSSRHFRWLIDEIDAADKPLLECLDPHFDLLRARKALEPYASSKGTGIAPVVDGLVETPRAIKVPKKVRVKPRKGPKVRSKIRGNGHVLRGLPPVVY